MYCINFWKKGKLGPFGIMSIPILEVLIDLVLNLGLQLELRAQPTLI